MKLRNVISVIGFASALSFVGAAQSALLTIHDNNGNTTSVGDGGLGSAVYVGPLGDWSLNIVAGLTKPAQGSPSKPSMDLSFNDLYSGAGGLGSILTIQWFDTGFLPSPATFISAIGGTLDGISITVNDYANGALLCTQTFTTQGAFSGTCSQSYSGSTPYSLEEDIIISYVGLNCVPTPPPPPGVPASSCPASSGDHSLRAPEPGTLALLGLGLLGAAAFRRRRNS
jgi:hypothetical protein